MRTRIPVCPHPDRPRYARGLCWPCYALKLWRGQTPAKDGAWAAYRRAQRAVGRTVSWKRLGRMRALDVGRHLDDPRLEFAEVVGHHPQGEPVVLADTPDEGSFDARSFGSQPPRGEAGRRPHRVDSPCQESA